MIDKVVDKVIKDGATITMIAPWWPEKPWFRRLKSLATANPILLNHSDDLFYPAITDNKVGIGRPNWSYTAAWRISRIPGEEFKLAKFENLPLL